jgi:site-specific DNA-methyltransferase (adenine-specific)
MGRFSSASCEWATPHELFTRWSAQLGPFDLDVCATPDNAKCARFFTKAEDGLRQPWTGKVWMNPPYGDEISQWVRKAWESVTEGTAELVVCLVPVRRSGWWHDWVNGKAEVIPLRGRVRFIGPDGKAGQSPFDSELLVFRDAGASQNGAEKQPAVAG